MKICTKCGLEKNFENFSKNSRSPDGHCARCKSCAWEQEKLRLSLNPEKAEERRIQNMMRQREKRGYTRTCSECHCTKLRNKFPKDPRNMEGRGPWCLSCIGEWEKKIIEGKVCSKCNKSKPLVEFMKNKHYLTGYSWICKECHRKEPRSDKRYLSVKDKQELGIDVDLSETKFCAKCQTFKSIAEMSIDKRNPTGVGSQCLSCSEAYIREYWNKNRALMLERTRKHWFNRHLWLNSLKNGSCIECGESFPPEAMDFDHVRGDKINSIGRMVTAHLNKILGEISKCELICANCHRVRTKKRKDASGHALTKIAQRSAAFKVKLNELKVKPCIDCGRSFPPEAMDFDHISGDKKYTISTMFSSPWTKVLEEIDKCELICANCHRVRTHKRRSSKYNAL